MRTLLRATIWLSVIALVGGGLAWLIVREETEHLVRDLVALRPPDTAPTRTYTLADRIEEIGPEARKRLNARFEAAGLAWPPQEVALIALKDENILELRARRIATPWTLVHRYPVLKASGTAGPKLRQGDKQVPEGVYRVTFLNPNSKFHVSLRLDYPNAFDQEMGARDGRADLGGDIMIHGKAASIGCLAMGDEAAEELFVLAHTVGLKRVKVVIAPTDFRKGRTVQPKPGEPKWLPDLYAAISREMAEF